MKSFLALLAVVVSAITGMGAVPTPYPPPFQHQPWTTNLDGVSAFTNVVKPGAGLSLSVTASNVTINADGSSATNAPEVYQGDGSVTVGTNGVLRPLYATNATATKLDSKLTNWVQSISSTNGQTVLPGTNISSVVSGRTNTVSLSDPAVLGTMSTRDFYPTNLYPGITSQWLYANSSGKMVGTNFPGSTQTNIDASGIVSGTIATARLGSGAASGSTFLAGDQTWKVVAGGGTGISTNAGSGTNNIFVSPTLQGATNTGTFTVESSGAVSNLIGGPLRIATTNGATGNLYVDGILYGNGSGLTGIQAGSSTNVYESKPATGGGVDITTNGLIYSFSLSPTLPERDGSSLTNLQGANINPLGLAAVPLAEGLDAPGSGRVLYFDGNGGDHWQSDIRISAPNIEGSGVAISNLNGALITANTINTNSFDVATRGLLGTADKATNTFFIYAAGLFSPTIEFFHDLDDRYISLQPDLKFHFSTNIVATGFEGPGSGLTGVQAANGTNGLASGAFTTVGTAASSNATAFLLTAGSTATGPILTTSSSSNSPAANELASAGWIRNLFNSGMLDYTTTNIDATATNGLMSAGQPIYKFASAIPPSATRTWASAFVTNGGYIGHVITTNTFTFLQGPVTVNAYIGATTAGSLNNFFLTIHPEIYYSYDKTNWFGDYDCQNQSVTGNATNLYQFVISFPAITSTNQAGFYIMRCFKVATASTAGNVPTVYFMVGTNAVSGQANASHISLSGPSSASGNAFLNNDQTFTGVNTFTSGTRSFSHDSTHTVITNTATRTSSEWTAGSQYEWYNGVKTLTIDKTNGNITANGTVAMNNLTVSNSATFATLNVTTLNATNLPSAIVTNNDTRTINIVGTLQQNGVSVLTNASGAAQSPWTGDINGAGKNFTNGNSLTITGQLSAASAVFTGGTSNYIGGSLFFLNGTPPPTPSTNGCLWPSNGVLYFVTTTKTNLVSDGR